MVIIFSMKTVWWSLTTLIMVLQIWFTDVTAEIRCYCNLPSCVSTGYMCKSLAGVCFSELPTTKTRRSHKGPNHLHINSHHHHQRHRLQSMDFTQTRHGCVESIKSHHKSARCKRSSYMSNESQVNRTVKTVGEWSIACCQSDMCNYIDSLDIKIQISTKSNNRSTDKKGSYRKKSRNSGKINDAATVQQDLWFKAAVIAVPIAGGFILVLLILLAVKMLRKDAAHQKQVLPMRSRQRHFDSKMACHHRYCDKNELNAKFNADFPLNQSNIFKNFNLSNKKGEAQQEHDRQSTISNSKFNMESDKLLFGSMASWAYFDSKNNGTSI